MIPQVDILSFIAQYLAKALNTTLVQRLDKPVKITGFPFPNQATEITFSLGGFTYALVLAVNPLRNTISYCLFSGETSVSGRQLSNVFNDMTPTMTSAKTILTSVSEVIKNFSMSPDQTIYKVNWIKHEEGRSVSIESTLVRGEILFTASGEYLNFLLSKRYINWGNDASAIAYAKKSGELPNA